MTIEELRTSGRLPSPKGVALSVMQLARREDATMEEIAEVVQTDPAITGRLIRLANSALHAGRPVAAVRDAAVRLGLRTVSQVTLGFSLVDQHLEGPCEAFDYPRFWSRSLLMALAARELGAQVHLRGVEELFACGLLADVGTLALATAYPSEYAEVLRRAGRGEAPLLELEQQVLQTDHDECTAELLRDFGIPETLAEPVYYHRCPAASGFARGSRPDRVLQTLALARRVADLGLASGAGRAELQPALLAEAAQSGLDAEALDALIERIVGDWHEWSELLRVPVHFAQPFPRMSAAGPVPGHDGDDPLPLRVLLIEEDAPTRLLLSGIISRLGHTVYPAVSREEALALAVEVVPQVVVTDCARPAATAVEFCHALRATDWGQSVYLIALTGAEGEAGSPEQLGLEADDYLPGPVSVPLMRLRLRAASRHLSLLQERERDRARLARMAADLAVSNRRLEEAALTDPLTNLPNRRAGMEFLTRAWNAADRYRQPLALMMIDVDGLQGINRRHGHGVGDEVVTAVASALRSSGRRCDHIARMGGAEFLVICPNTEPGSLHAVADRLHGTVRSLGIVAGADAVPVTIGIGLASREADMHDPEALIRAADRALRAAKKAGQGRIRLVERGRVHAAAGS
ncbi:MAG: HDOD domain-containing protein [Thioalkalivibrio sp.]|nr:MAG: HDOD domain-containing protein [Thioalkalivibrio sp.]